MDVQVSDGTQFALDNSPLLAASAHTEVSFLIYAHSKARKSDGHPVTSGLIGRDGPDTQGWAYGDAAERHAAGMRVGFPDWIYVVVKTTETTGGHFLRY